MKQHRFLINKKIQNRSDITITDKDIIHQMKNVLRLQSGNPITLLDGTGKEWNGKVDIISKEFVKLNEGVVTKKEGAEGIKINLYSAMIKKDKYEWILQKGTEIGVFSFTPVITKRTEKINLNIKRAEKIIKEAVEQSERTDVPTLSEPVDIQTALTLCETKMLVFDKSGKPFSVSQYKNEKEINIFIGPEGGFDESDMEIFKEKGADVVSLGDRVLRAETAAIVVPSLFIYQN